MRTLKTRSNWLNEKQMCRGRVNVMSTLVEKFKKVSELVVIQHLLHGRLCPLWLHSLHRALLHPNTPMRKGGSCHSTGRRNTTPSWHKLINVLLFLICQSWDQNPSSVPAILTISTPLSYFKWNSNASFPLAGLKRQFLRLPSTN